MTGKRALTLKTMAAAVMAAAISISSIGGGTVHAADKSFASAVRFNLKKGSTVTLQTYVENLGYRKFTARLTKKKVAKTISTIINGEADDFNRVTMTVHINTPANYLSDSDIDRLDGKNFFYYVTAHVVNMDTGTLGSTFYTGSNHVLANKINEKTGKYKLVTEFDLKYDFYKRSDDYIALGVSGRTTAPATGSMSAADKDFWSGTGKFTKTTYYSGSNKKLSSFIRIL